MISLIKADLYKETRKKSFKWIVLLIIFVSILAMTLINKNLKTTKEYFQLYPIFSEEEYMDVNKYGSYKHYLENYDKYEKVVNSQNEIISKTDVNNLEVLLESSQNFIYVLGVLILFLAFHSFSYDYQKYSLKYLFQCKKGRKKIYFSKVISILILASGLFALLLLVMCITGVLLTHENIFTMKTLIYSHGSIKEVLFILEFLKTSIFSLVPLFFVIIFSMFLSILFRGNSFGLVLSGVIYFGGLIFSQIMFNYGFPFIQYTFLPFIDFTYLSDIVTVSFNNIIYDLNFGYCYSGIILGIYSFLFMCVSLLLLNRDV